MVLCVQYTSQYTARCSFFPCSVQGTDFLTGELAQLARASALQAEGQGFEPPILHIMGQ